MNSTALYIGITGLRSKHVAELARFYENLVADWESGKKKPSLSIGLLTSRKFLNREPTNPMHLSRMNTREDITFACDSAQEFPSSKIIVHYNPSGGYHYPEIQTQIEFLLHEDIDGIEWDSFKSTKTTATVPIFPRSFPGKIEHGFISILQIGKEDYENPSLFVERMKDSDIAPNYTHLLFDESNCRGLLLDEQKAVDWITTLRDHGNTRGITLSGGIGIDTIPVIAKIKDNVGDETEISIDLTKKVRHLDEFSIERAKAFLVKTIMLYK